MTLAADKLLNRGLDRFQDTRSNARKFHARSIGSDVDPDHCFGDFLVCVAAAGTTNRPHLQRDGLDRLEKEYRCDVMKTAMAVNSGLTGGYTVPHELTMELFFDFARGCYCPTKCVCRADGNANLDVPAARCRDGAKFRRHAVLRWHQS